VADVSLISRPCVQAVKRMEQRRDPKLKQLIDYLEKEKLPSNDCDARKVVAQAPNFTLIDKILDLLDGRIWTEDKLWYHVIYKSRCFMIIIVDVWQDTSQVKDYTMICVTSGGGTGCIPML